MNESSRITIELLQTLLNSPRLKVILNKEEKDCINSGIKQITYLEDSLHKSREFHLNGMRDMVS